MPETTRYNTKKNDVFEQELPGEVPRYRVRGYAPFDDTGCREEKRPRNRKRTNSHQGAECRLKRDKCASSENSGRRQPYNAEQISLASDPEDRQPPDERTVGNIQCNAVC